MSVYDKNHYNIKEKKKKIKGKPLFIISTDIAT